LIKKQTNGIYQLDFLFCQIDTSKKQTENKAKLLHEDKVIVLSKISGTVARALPDSNDLPQFPGVPFKKLINKKFQTLALDIHKIVDEKIKQSFHIEDWQTALAQILNRTPAPDFGFDRAYIDF